MMDILVLYAQELWEIVNELAPWLLFGMLVAGVLHVAMPTGYVRRKLGGKGFWEVLKATAFGVPLPLCSCGVIPAAVGLKKEGASNGAATGFLISTPQTGVDSILVSASFLGWPFALFKVFSALVMGLAGGVLVNRWDAEDTTDLSGEDLAVTPVAPARDHPLRRAWRFIYHTLLRDIYRWLVLGILVAALISTLVPPDFFTRYAWLQGFPAMLLMLLLAVPLYVCATASVPIAASLIMAGLPLGSALVFLMAGPATNVATVGAVIKTFGKRVAGIYLGTVVIGSLALGWLFQSVLQAVGDSHAASHSHFPPEWLTSISTIVLLGMLASLVASDLWAWWRSHKKRSIAAANHSWLLQVDGMTCQNCVRNVHQALAKLDSVADVKVDLDQKTAVVQTSDVDPQTLVDQLAQVGYPSRLADSN